MICAAGSVSFQMPSCQQAGHVAVYVFRYFHIKFITVICQVHDQVTLSVVLFPGMYICISLRKRKDALCSATPSPKSAVHSQCPLHYAPSFCSALPLDTSCRQTPVRVFNLRYAVPGAIRILYCRLRTSHSPILPSPIP